MNEPTTPRRWRPRFSLRTLVLGVVVYGALWTATEIWGGRAFRERIEAQTDELQRATIAWSKSQAREAEIWQDEAFYFPAEKQPAAIPRPPAGELVAPGSEQNPPLVPQTVTAFCDVETLAVAPFLLRVQYTYICTDAYGRSLPLTQEGAAAPDGQGWVVWCFGYSWMPDMWK